MNPLVFESAELVLVPVSVGAERYVLSEADALAGCRYRNALMEIVKRDETGKVISYDGLAEAEITLISLLLFKDMQTDPKKPPIKGDPVPREVIAAWPNKITTQLYDAAKELSPGLVRTKDTNPTSASSPTSTPTG